MWLFKHVAKTQTETSPVQYRVLWLKFQPGSLFEQLNMKRIGVTFPGEQSWPPGSLGLHFCWTCVKVQPWQREQNTSGVTIPLMCR